MLPSYAKLVDNAFPSRLLGNLPGSLRRGDDDFVPVSLETATRLLFEELGRVYRDFGAQSVRPPRPRGRGSKICRPERVINRCLGCVRKPGPRLDVLSWGLR